MEQEVLEVQDRIEDLLRVIDSQKEVIAKQKQAYDNLMESAKKIEVERDCIVSLIKTVVESGFQKN